MAVELTRGDRITLLTSDDEQWFLAETEDHRRGWFEVQSYDLLANGLRARYVFEGLLVID